MRFLTKKQKKKGEFMFPNEFGLFAMDQPPMDYNEPEESTFPPKISLGMMYVPFQRFEKLYSEEKALERGTLFEELDFPFYGGKGGMHR